MHICHIVVVAVVVVVCDGRLVLQKPPQSLPKPGPPAGSRSNNGGAPKSPPAPSDFNICFPYQCYRSQFEEQHFPDYARKLIYGGKWLKQAKEPFNPAIPDRARYINFNKYFSDTTSGKNREFAVPVVLQLDMPAQSFLNFSTRREALDREFKLMNATVNAKLDQLKLLKPRKPAEEAALHMQRDAAHQSWRRQLLEATLQCLKDNNQTLYNYMNPVYQSGDPRNRGQVETPTGLTTAKLTTVTVGDVSVYVRGFVGQYGVLMAPRYASELLSFINKPAADVTTFFVADYLNGFFEVWMSANPTQTLFP